MATRDTAFAAGTPCWIDLMTSDAEASKAFYGALFGWTFAGSPEEFGGYMTCIAGDKAVAGLMGGNTPESGHPDVWTTYLATTDIDATIAAATAAGGAVLAPVMEVGELGKMAIISDSAGASVGLWEAGVHTGFNRYNEAGAVCWDELHTKDFAASSEFYTTVFGWTMNSVGDTDDFRYATGQLDGQDVAGMMDAKLYMPAEVPSTWTVYFGSTDVDATVAKAVELGATVVRPAEDTPFGRLVDMCDPTGAAFKLVSVTA